MNIDFKNKKILVTGSSKGIGLAIAKAFLDNSAKVIFNSNNLRNLRLLKKEINNENMFIFKANLLIDSEIKKLVEYANKKLNGIDVVICNYGDGRKIKDIGNETYNDWLIGLKKNLLSASSLINHSKKYLIKSNHSSIICISSICGLSSSNAPLDYSASKAALNSFVKNQSKILGKYNIRINTISPGNIYSEDGRWPKKFIKNKNLKKSILNNVPLKRFGTPTEIANAVMFLSSSYSSFTTGSNLVIDGGESLWHFLKIIYFLLNQKTL